MAAELASHLAPGDFVALIGPLGAGKSVVARAIGQHLGVTGPMPSPTYTIMTVHQGTLPIYHMDLYRIGSIDEFELAGLHTYFESDGVCLVEWAERVRTLWPTAGWSATLRFADGNKREITIERWGGRFNQ